MTLSESESTQSSGSPRGLPKRRRGHPRRVRPPKREWKRYVASEFAVFQFRDLHPDGFVGGCRWSSYDADAHARHLLKLWMKRGRFFGRGRRGDKIIVCRPPKGGRKVYLLVRPGREKSGIIRVLTERQARELARESRRRRHR